MKVHRQQTAMSGQVDNTSLKTQQVGGNDDMAIQDLWRGMWLMT